MNMWGFTRSFLDEAWKGFPAFLDKALAENPAKAEYFVAHHGVLIHRAIGVGAQVVVNLLVRFRAVVVVGVDNGEGGGEPWTAYY